MDVNELYTATLDIMEVHKVLQVIQNTYLGDTYRVSDENLDTTLSQLFEELEKEEKNEEHLMILDGCLGICYGICDSCTKKFEELNAAKDEKWMKYVLKNYRGEWNDMVGVEQQFQKDIGTVKEVLDGISKRVDGLRG